MGRTSTTIPKGSKSATAKKLETPESEPHLQAVPQTQAQVVLELQDVHSKFHSNDEALVRATAEVKSLKADKERLDVRREKLLNMLAGIDQPEIQGELDLEGGDDE